MIKVFSNYEFQTISNSHDYEDDLITNLKLF